MFNKEYADWKGWNKEQIQTKTLNAYYKEIFKLTKLDKNSKILEVGFGNGEFLKYAENNGYKIVGVELNQYLVEKNKEKYEVYGDSYINETCDKFDAIFLFDVLEHIDRNKLIAYIKKLLRVLRSGGVIVARFPNGDSPLSCINYNSDITHKINIGSGIVNFITSSLDLEILYGGGDLTPIRGTTNKTKFHRIITLPILMLLDIIIKIIYLRWESYSITSPNALIILKK